MASRTKKKPAPRKPAASKAKSTGFGLPSIGWLAAAGVVAAWAVSDGRPARYARSTIDAFQTRLPALAPRDEVASLIGSASPERPAPRPDHLRRPTPPALLPSPTDRTGSIAPAPRPAPLQYAAIPKPSPSTAMFTPQPRVDVAYPVESPAKPLARPHLEVTPARPALMPPLAMGTTSPASGGQRHATRELVVHAAPDGASAKLGAVDSGSSVLVMRSAGGWRYVRSEASKAEGWVDGRFLAGEATAENGPVTR